MRGGATPGTFDGDQSIVLNDPAQQIVMCITSNSLSVYTDDEGTGIAIKLTSSSNWSHDLIFPAGGFAPSGCATNTAVKLCPQEITPLDLAVKGNTQVKCDITTVAGDTQTGTNDVTIGLGWTDGRVPGDILLKIPNVVGLKGSGTISSGVAVTAETALTTFKIPGFATEIIGGKFIMVHDGAVTQSEEITGFVRLDLGISDQGVQNWPLNGGIPNLGTEVEGAAINLMPWIPMHIPLPDKEITVNPHSNLYGAVTGGVEVVVSLAWR